eukprot:15336168-Ditylum_brightwellii.AAC.1
MEVSSCHYLEADIPWHVQYAAMRFAQSGTSTVVTADQNVADSSVPEQRSQLGIEALGGGSGSCRKN